VGAAINSLYAIQILSKVFTVVLSFDALQSPLLTASLNKLQAEGQTCVQKSRVAGWQAMAFHVLYNAPNFLSSQGSQHL
jgi:hypothetical protein